MAELETAIYTRLAAYEGLTALISTRIYPMILPQNPTYPAVTYQRTDGVRESGMTTEHGMAHPGIQIDSWDKTYAGAKAVATQVRGALQRWSSEAADPIVLDCFLESDGDNYEPDTGAYHVQQSWTIWHRE